MKMRFIFSTLVLCLTTAVANAQHAGDVEFGYDNLATPTSIVIEPVEVTSENFLLFESEFEPLDPNVPTDLSADEPGFNTNPAENFFVNSGDQIWLSAVNASVESTFGVGYLNFYNPTNDTLEASGRISVIDNTTGTADLVINGGAVESGPIGQFIGAADSDDEVHDHVVFDLLDDASAPVGAYGMMFRLQSDFDADGNMDIESDPFWLVINHGMSEDDFESMAIPKFGITAVPEPSSATMLLIGLSAMCVNRRRRQS